MGSTSEAAARAQRESVLDLPSEKKLEYFSRIIARHPNMNSALDDLLTLTAPATGTDIVLLIGPSGVGKSETVATARKRLLSRFETAMQVDPGLIPVVVTEAPASGELQFSWRMLYTKIGEALHEPLLDRKRLTVIEDGCWNQRPCMAGSTVAALRMAIEKALKQRGARLLVIDEAAHLLSDPRPAKLLAHMDALKSLANVSGITLVLVGSYDLYSLVCLNGQLARRCAVIHLSRYRCGNKADEACFRRVLAELQKWLPIAEPPDLAPFSQHLQEACVGCVGTLKETLTRALACVLEKGDGWKTAYLERALICENQVARILAETTRGEESLVRAVYGTRPGGCLGSVC
jgi:AAA domain